MTASIQAVSLPDRTRLEQLFREKHGAPEQVGWAPRRRFASGYYTPSDIYECLVDGVVTADTLWLDVGGGRSVFPENPALARRVAARCRRVVAADPSRNVLENSYVHEKVQSLLEDFTSPMPFDLATMRMVVEHVERPENFVAALARLVRSGGVAIVFTVNRWSPLTVLSRWVPFRWHHGIKQAFWGNGDGTGLNAADTFPVQDKMNSRRALKELFQQAGFEEELFARLDDLSLFGKFSFMNRVELAGRTALRRVGLPYPEHCLLAAYRRR